MQIKFLSIHSLIIINKLQNKKVIQNIKILSHTKLKVLKINKSNFILIKVWKFEILIFKINK